MDFKEGFDVGEFLKMCALANEVIEPRGDRFEDRSHEADTVSGDFPRISPKAFLDLKTGLEREFILLKRILDPPIGSVSRDKVRELLAAGLSDTCRTAPAGIVRDTIAKEISSPVSLIAFSLQLQMENLLLWTAGSYIRDIWEHGKVQEETKQKTSERLRDDLQMLAGTIEVLEDLAAFKGLEVVPLNMPASEFELPPATWGRASLSAKQVLLAVAQRIMFQLVTLEDPSNPGINFWYDHIASEAQRLECAYLWSKIGPADD